MSEYAIGIDIGGTNTKFGIVDRGGNILEKGRLFTKKPGGVREFINALYNKVGTVEKKNGEDENFQDI